MQPVCSHQRVMPSKQSRPGHPASVTRLLCHSYPECQPLSLQPQRGSRITTHPARSRNGMFWSTSYFQSYNFNRKHTKVFLCPKHRQKCCKSVRKRRSHQKMGKRCRQLVRSSHPRGNCYKKLNLNDLRVKEMPVKINTEHFLNFLSLKKI